eukprot:CAMPEP_0174720478 /NCGR_PEP_ID=MMETSP1094-20130205/33606_1 /TAXON_ID=156173 /ORGANISM="Chrysochromulina brevifilum, Strain UTEX LB 985" /LENGTH=179 /DNA_ID=CAMNT_0015920961 /DNA_START=454 /DNA_END=994 /DNA_ORIENTATION=+
MTYESHTLREHGLDTRRVSDRIEEAEAEVRWRAQLTVEFIGLVGAVEDVGDVALGEKLLEAAATLSPTKRRGATSDMGGGRTLPPRMGEHVRASGEASCRVLLRRRFRLDPGCSSEGDSRVSCCGAAKRGRHMGETLISRGASGVGDGMEGSQLMLALADCTTATGEVHGVNEEGMDGF